MVTALERSLPAYSSDLPTEACSDAQFSLRSGGVPWQPALVGVLVIGLALLVLPLMLAKLQDEEGHPSSPQSGPRGAQAQTVPDQPTTRPAEESPFVTRDKDGRLQWPRPRTDHRQRERDRMVDSQIGRGSLFHDAVKDQRVLAAMRSVPRHEFVPERRRDSAYDDTPLPIGYGQTISQPYIVALMTALLDVKEGQRVLEIGTGSGYQAAVLNELTPHVHSIEILEPLYKQATERFDKLGYKTVQTRLGDGYDGWKEHAPFDGVIVTCAAGHVPPPLWEQLKEGGRMVIPIGGVYETQRLLVLTKQTGGRRKSRNVLPVRFVPMTGKIQKP
ncbi:MAG: protein-L-isoaspartate(D-aspartate) O-methyltransferase [Phycisphaerae bacterium]